MSVDNVEDVSPRVQYVATAAQVDFDYPFSIFANGDLTVVVDSVTKTLTTHYTVTGAGDDAGGTVTFLVAMTGGEIVTIYRDLPIERTSDFSGNGPWSSSAVNDEFDRMTMIDQQLEAGIERCLRIPTSAEVDDADIEIDPASWANMYLTFDADGKPTPAALSSATMTQGTIGQLLYPRTAAEIAVSVTPTNYAIPSHEAIGDVLIERYFTAGLDTSLQANAATVTTAIHDAKLVAVQAGAEVRLRGKLYYVLPATSTSDEGGTIVIVTEIVSNMHFSGQRGCEIKWKDGVSTQGAPVRAATFHTNQAVSNVSFKGIKFNGNGANNKVTTSPPPYNADFNQAHISFSGTPSGVAARVDNLSIDDCKFTGVAGVCAVVLGQSNTVGVTLGKGARITNCDLDDNGTDSRDFTGIFAWMDDVLCTGCNFRETTMYAGTTGGVTAYEVHGARHKFYGNNVKNYYRGVYLAGNYTSDTVGTEIFGNTFFTGFYGVQWFRESASQPELLSSSVCGNYFFFDSSTVSGAPAEKAALSCNTLYDVKGIHASNNTLRATDTVVNTVFFEMSASTVAGQKNEHIVLKSNEVYNATGSVNIRANSTNSIGYIEIDGLTAIDLNNAASTAPTSIYIDGSTTGIDYLQLDNINCADTRGGSAQCDYNVRLTGTIHRMVLGTVNSYGMITADYDESGASISNRRGINGGYAIVASAANIVIPANVNTVSISGTTNITSITSGGVNSGRQVTLVFQGALTFTDGGNLRLAGNMVTAQDDTITLVCDSTDWFEVARSVN